MSTGVLRSRGDVRASVPGGRERTSLVSDYFSRQDIVSMLRAVVAANADIANRLSFPEARAYRAGFAAAIRAVAIGFSINPELEAGLFRLDQEPPSVELDYWESSTPALPPPGSSLHIIGDPEDADSSPE